MKNMSRRKFFGVVGATLVGAAVTVLPNAGNAESGVEAKLYSYVRCPECGCAMTRVPGKNDEMLITCCGKTYKEPTIKLVKYGDVLSSDHINSVVDAVNLLLAERG